MSEYARLQPGVAGAFVAGSVARGDASPFSDVDLRILLDADPLPPAYFVVDSGVPLEWKFLPPSLFADAEEVLHHPFRAAELSEAVILFDPSNALRQLREQILPVHAREEYRLIRARRLAEAALQTFGDVEIQWRERGMLPLWNYRCALFWGAEACLVSEGLPPSHLRLIPRLREATTNRGKPALHDGFLEAFGAGQKTFSEAERLWEAVFGLMDSLPETVASGHPYLSRSRIPLWRQGITELLTAGGNVSFPMWSFLALMWSLSPADSEIRSGCATVLERVGFDRPYGVERCLSAARDWTNRLKDAFGIVGLSTHHGMRDYE